MSINYEENEDKRAKLYELLAKVILPYRSNSLTRCQLLGHTIYKNYYMCHYKYHTLSHSTRSKNKVMYRTIVLTRLGMLLPQLANFSLISSELSNVRATKLVDLHINRLHEE